MLLKIPEQWIKNLAVFAFRNNERKKTRCRNFHETKVYAVDLFWRQK